MTMGVVEEQIQTAPSLSLRQYLEDSEDPKQKRVRGHYRLQHKTQTVEFVNKMRQKWLRFDHGRLTIMDCLRLLDQLVDESDPDMDDANIIHAFQTAERMREAVPDKPWMHLTALIHDLGKVMSIWGEDQIAVTGDTYPVGCRPASSIVYGIESFKGNPDLDHPVYSTKLGMYREHCGIENLLMTWSHDEYMYQVLRNHPQCTLPEESLYAIRFHSFYPYHTNREYLHFASARDDDLLASINELNNVDLYSKVDVHPDVDQLQDYYQSLVDRYIPGVVRW
jgi:inositol oxygenase